MPLQAGLSVMAVTAATNRCASPRHLHLRHRPKELRRAARTMPLSIRFLLEARFSYVSGDIVGNNKQDQEQYDNVQRAESHSNWKHHRTTLLLL